MKHLKIILLLLVFTNAQIYAIDFRLVKAAENLENPWAMAFLPDNSILVTERPGRLKRFVNGNMETVSGLPSVHASGQGGLLDIALHPDFIINRLVYLTMSVSGSGGSGTALYRAELSGSTLVNGEFLYVMPVLSRGSAHYGSRIVFGSDGKIYMSIGDRGDRNRSQNLSDSAGSTLRFNDNGTIPADNPYNEIFSWGHRNAQGMAVNPQTGEVWQHEHGPRGGDEINIIRRGANYGWPLVTHGREYSGGIISTETTAPGIEDPVLVWTPSIAPSGMMFYSGKLFPEWKGSLFAGALAGTHLRRVMLEGNRVTGEEVLLKDRIGRIRDVREAPDGTIWLLTDERNGALYRIEP